MKGPLPNWDKNVHYVVSHDFFKTNHEKVVSCGNQFDIVNGKVSGDCGSVQPELAGRWYTALDS